MITVNFGTSAHATAVYQSGQYLPKFVRREGEVPVRIIRERASQVCTKR